MKKFIPAVLAATLLLSAAGCNFNMNTADETTSVQQNSTAVNGVTETVAQETTVPETTTAAGIGSASAYKEGATITGYTSKGFEIAEKDGITYIDGILIVNKTYSIPESYNPGGLTDECSAAFEKMSAAAAQDGLNLYVLSGFRSYETQQGLYSRYCASDGQDAADRYSARPGHSEHQTGLAIDVNSVKNAFKDTPEGIWLAAHCAEYGFILRYPEGKESVTGYIYEPWHVRYIGNVQLCQQLTESGLTLEEYFGVDSVYAD